MFSQIADKMGTDRSYIANLNSRTREMVYPSTADKVIALYNEFSMIPVYESTWMNLRARNEALRKGFPGPLAWDDNIDDPYALPSGLTHPQAYVWFWNAASMTERIEWVLEHGLSVTRLNRSTLSRKHRRGSWQVL